MLDFINSLLTMILGHSSQFPSCAASAEIWNLWVYVASRPFAEEVGNHISKARGSSKEAVWPPTYLQCYKQVGIAIEHKHTQTRFVFWKKW